jgi:phosphatidylserine/phosphatidylglycerophosphate/cardiolipin synthase-like enzyme
MPAEGSQDAHEWVKVLAAEILVCRSRGLHIRFPADALPKEPGRRSSTVALLERLGVELDEEPA